MWTFVLSLNGISLFVPRFHRHCHRRRCYWCCCCCFCQIIIVIQHFPIFGMKIYAIYAITYTIIMTIMSHTKIWADINSILNDPLTLLVHKFFAAELKCDWLEFMISFLKWITNSWRMSCSFELTKSESELWNWNVLRNFTLIDAWREMNQAAAEWKNYESISKFRWNNKDFKISQ